MEWVTCYKSFILIIMIFCSRAVSLYVRGKKQSSSTLNSRGIPGARCVNFQNTAVDRAAVMSWPQRNGELHYILLWSMYFSIKRYHEYFISRGVQTLLSTHTLFVLFSLNFPRPTMYVITDDIGHVLPSSTKLPLIATTQCFLNNPKKEIHIHFVSNSSRATSLSVVT